MELHGLEEVRISHRLGPECRIESELSLLFHQFDTDPLAVDLTDNRTMMGPVDSELLFSPRGVGLEGTRIWVAITGRSSSP